MKRQLTEAEAQAAGVVFQTHQPFVQSVARRFAQSPDDVPDIVQTVGLHVCRQFSRFRGESNVKTWLYAVTQNAAVDHYRRTNSQIGKPRTSLQQHPPNHLIEPGDHVEAGQRSGAIREALERLRPKHKLAIRRLLDDPDVSEVSKSTRRRAIHRMRELLADDPRVR